MAVAEATDDEGAEIGDSGAGDHPDDGVEEGPPDLDVGESLDALVLLEMRVRHARPVAADPLYGDGLLILAEELGREDVVGHPQVEDDGPAQADDAEDDVEPLPDGDAGAVDVADAVGENRLNDDGQAVAAEPDAHAHRHLVFGIPGARDEHVGGTNTGFGEP